MTVNPLFGMLALLLVAGVVVDLWLGRGMKRRGLLQACIVVVFILVLLTMPRCSGGDPNEPDGPDIPYRS